MTVFCPICACTSSRILDLRPRVPVLMHSLFDNPEAARGCKTAAMELRRCDDCGFAWNAAFDPDVIVYGPDYDNAQAHSQRFRDHLVERIDAIFDNVPLDSRVNLVEVGCGQGDFLARLLERHPEKVDQAIGFDPAWRGANGEGPASSRLYRRFFDAGASDALRDAAPDIIISRHTIEHIADPLAFLRAIRAGIGPREGVRLFLETPDISWIIKHGAFEDVFYEHCSIFDPHSMNAALTRAGFGEASTSLCFGEQYLWTSATSALGEPLQSPRKASMQSQIGTAALVAHWQERIREIAARGGRFAVWGAGAKGMTFAQIVDPICETVTALVDVNPGKQGRYIGMSGHAVIAPGAIQAHQITDFVVMNPNYLTEIETILRENGVFATLHTLHERH